MGGELQSGVLSYTPAANANGSATITLRLNDDGGTANGGVNSSATQTFTINVTAVNDAPSFTAGPNQTVNEDAPAQTVNPWATAISAGPPDEAGQTLGFNITNNSNPTLFSAAPVVIPTGALTYMPAANANGVATSTLTLSDNGSNTPPNVNTSAAQTFTITVAAVNDAPVNTVPGAQTTGDSVPVVFGTANTNAISVADLDAGAGIVQMSFGTGAPANGTLTLANPGAVLTSLTGNGSELVIATGTLTALNTALNGPAGSLTYTPVLGTSAARTLTVISNDQGNTGSGGALIDTDTVTINVDAPPVVSSVPVNGATTANNVAIAVNFNESVDVIAGITLDCGGAIALGGTTGSNVSTLNLTYAAPLPAGTCTLTVPAASVSDVDPIDPPNNPVANYVATFSVDAAPALVSSTPAAAAVVNTAQTVSFTYNEPVTDLGGAITLNCGGAVAGSIGGSGSATLTFTPTSPLAAGASCTATAVAAQIGDVDTFDPPQNPVANSIINFTVDAAPAFVSATPAAAAVVGTGQTVSFTFDENVDNLGGAITLDCGGAVTGTIGGGGTPTLTFAPNNPLTAGASCTATAVAAQIGDSDAIDPPQNPVANVVRSFAVDAAPTVVTTNPANGAVDVPLAGIVTFDFSEAVNFNFASFSYSCGGAVTFNVAGSGTSSATLTPTANLPINTLCTVTALAAGIRDLDAADPPDYALVDTAIVLTTVNDDAPTVISTVPNTGAYARSDVVLGVVFSESVTALPGAIELRCDGSSNLIVGGDSGVDVSELAPETSGPLPAGACRMTIRADHILDSDSIDPPDQMPADVLIDFIVALPPSFTSQPSLNSPELDSYQYPVVIDDSRTARPVTLSIELAPSGATLAEPNSLLQIPTAEMTPPTSHLAANPGCLMVPQGQSPVMAMPMLRWRFPGGVGMSPLVGPLLDRNNDGITDSRDPTTILLLPHDTLVGIEAGVSVPTFIDGATGLWLAELPDIVVKAGGNPAYADLDGDGRHDILAFLPDLSVIAFKTDGTVLWTSSATASTASWGASVSLGVADFEGDGVPEILAGGTVLNADGSVRWQSAHPIPGGFDSPFYVDPIGNGEGLVVMGNDVHAESGALLWSVPLSQYTGGRVWHIGAADFDADGVIEILFMDKDIGQGSARAHYRLYRPDGTLVWERAIEDGLEYSGNTPVIADFTGDGLPDFVTAGARSLRLYKGDGGLVWSVPLENEGSDSVAAGAFDFDGDGRLEVVVHDHRRLLFVDGQNGQVRFAYRHASRTANEQPVIADIDGDGSAEVLVASDAHGESGLYAYGSSATPWSPTLPLWNQYQYNVTNGVGPSWTNGQTGLWWQQQRTFRVNNRLQPDPTLMFDLVPHRLRLLDDPLRLEFDVLNRGRATSSAYLAWIESAGGVAIGQLSGVSLATGANARHEVALGTFHAAPSDLRVRIEASDPTFECDTANNQATGRYAKLRATAADGQFATQDWLINIDQVNAPPSIADRVLPDATVGLDYAQVVSATDPDLGDAVRLAILEGPPGLVLHPQTGELNWRPPLTAIGQHVVRVSASDLAGQTAERTFSLQVNGNSSNLPPVFRSIPVTSVAHDAVYIYQFLVEDPEGEPLTFTLLESLPSMYVSPEQLVVWGPDAEYGSTRAVHLRATDPHGAHADQQFTVTLLYNNAPQITSTPALFGYPDFDYRYLVTAIDADLDPIVYSLARAPSGMQIDAHSGQLDWTPNVNQIGAHPVLVRASDGKGGIASQPFTLVVRADNEPPTITTIPPVVAKVDREYRYDLDAIDPEGAPLLYAFRESPAGMQIDAETGLIQWTPSTAGSAAVTVRVDDGEDYVEQLWTINVAAADEPLLAFLSIDPPRVPVDAPVAVQVSESGAAGAVTRQLFLDGTTPIPLDANGHASVSASALGRHTLQAVVSDDYETAHGEGSFLVIDAGDTTPPVVDLIAPSDNAEITAPTPVRITVQDAQLVEWTLHFRESNSPDAPLTRMASGTENVNDAAVAEFDPTLLLNGQYTIYLQATDEGGNTVDDSVVVRVTGDMKIGNFSLTFEEVSIPVAGIPVTVSRTYDTRRRNETLDFGHGWSIDYQNVRIHESTKLGFSWQIREVRNGVLTHFCNESNGDRVVTVTLPDGSVESFRAVAVPHCNLAVPEPNVHLAFEPIDGTDSTLEQSSYGLLRLQTIAGFPGMMTLIDLSSAEAPVDPSVYTLTLPEGLVYELDQDFGIRRVVDLDGNFLEYSEGGVEHSSGIGIDFERDAQGRIEALVLPDGERIEYAYSAAGDLLAARDQLGLATTFEYGYALAPHYLTRIYDARNLPVARNEFDDDGRLVASIDAQGYRIEFDHQIPQRLERVRDRRGNFTTYSYDEEGRVLTETNALNQTITRTYDNDGNVLTETDALDRVRTMTWDERGNQLTETNDLGQTDTRTYNARNQLPTEVDDLERRVIKNQYNPFNGALIRTENALDQATLFSYDSGIGSGETGELVGISDPLGRATGYTLDAAGRGWRVRETDAVGTQTTYSHDSMGRVIAEARPRTLADGSVVQEVTTTTYDEKGRVRRVDHPDGSFSTTDYNAIDKPERECDALSRCTTTIYNTRGEIDLVIYADDTFEQTTYDENGNTIAQRDRGGRTTRMVYDVANRLIETIYPDATPENGDDGDPANNPRTINEYDAAGQLRFVTNERGHRTEYRYDKAGRQTHVIDALGNTTVTSYDNAGQRSSVTDAEDRTTKFEYDRAGRLIETVHPDETAGNDGDNPRTRVDYDAAGQKIAAIDEMGRITRYAYDALGRLERVVLPNPITGVNPELVDGQSPAGSGTLTTRYVYDQRGNKTQQIDALGRITRFEYDSMGRQTARELPLGQRETMTYNRAGEQTGKLTFNGEIIALNHDGVGRLHSISLPDRTRSFSYTLSGQVSQIAEDNEAWRFAFDARDRLTRAEDAAGRSVDYRYDAAGNRIELQTCSDVAGSCVTHQQVTYAYDELNRLREVVATLDGGAPQATEYRYRPVGSRSGMTHPNGTVVDYTYDVRNRLKTLIHKASNIAGAASLLALSYGVDASGLRTQIAETRPGDAATPTYTRVTDFQYDAVQRLTREQVSGNHGDPDRVHAWTYDAVGNRLTQLATVGAGSLATTLTTSYDYDANDRLLSTSVAGALSGPLTTAHDYDAAGNLTATHEGATTTAQYTWDAEGRLTGAVLGNGPTQKTTAYRYDPNGIRRSQQITEASGAVARMEYLVDPNQAYAQVLEEWTATAPSGPLPDETLATAYVYGDDLISQTRLALAGTPTTSVYHYDGLGTTRALSAHKVDAAGAPQAGHGEITDRYAYTAFGESDPAGTSGDTSGTSENDYRYTGEQLDPNLGFYYLRARYMDPGQGRFLGMDPFAGSSEEPRSLQKYEYVSNSPVGLVDPGGLCFTQSDGYGVEREIEPQYEQDFPGNGTIYGRPFPYLKPDILDPVRRIYMEIKPASITGAAAASCQMAAYWAEFGASGAFVPPFFPDPHWTPRRNPITVNGRPLWVENVMGVLFYSDDRALAYELSFAADLATAKRKIRYSHQRIEVAPGMRSINGEQAAVALLVAGVSGVVAYNVARMMPVLLTARYGL